MVDEMDSKNSGGRGASSLGDSFSIESFDADADADAADSSFSDSNASHINQAPTLKAYELELRKAFAAVATVEQHRRASHSANRLIKAATKEEEETIRNTSRRTSADWEEMIRKKEEEKRRKRDAELAVQTAVSASPCAVVPIDVGVAHDIEENSIDPVESGVESDVESDIESDVEVPVNAGQENETKAVSASQPQQRELIKSHKRRIMALSMMMTFGLMIILGLVIGLSGKGNNTATSQNLRGENEAPTPTSIPTPAVMPSKQPTSSDEGTISMTAPMEIAVAEAEAEAAAIATTVGAVSGQSPLPTTTSTQPTKSNSTTLVCDLVKPAGDQCNQALQLLEKCVSSETALDHRYGTSIAIHANGEDVLAIVGANFDNHATLLSYDKSTQTWNHVSNLNSFDSNSDSSSMIFYNQFKSAVAISSEWIAISTPIDMASSSVTLYLISDAIQNGDNAVPDFSIEQADKKSGSRFGSSLAIDDKILVVGAERDRDNKGSVYIYRDDNGWRLVSKLQSDNVSAHPQGNFGHSLAISQGILAVGAPNDTVNGMQRCGSVYIFQQTPGGFAYIQKISPRELLAGDQFGYVVTIDVTNNPTTDMREDRIAIGTHMDDDKGMDSGSVYIYLRRDGERSFSLEQKLLPTEVSPKAAFGSSIDMQGYRMVVGSKGYGVARLFEYNGESWVEIGSTKDVDSGRALGDDFGSSVSIASWEESINGHGGVVLVGAPLNDEAGEDSGRIYSYAICNTD
eukprot:scaffold6038_cov106-Skeletonema_dohrnii-CCMP3373.AAC.4